MDDNWGKSGNIKERIGYRDSKKMKKTRVSKVEYNKKKIENRPLKHSEITPSFPTLKFKQ